MTIVITDLLKTYLGLCYKNSSNLDINVPLTSASKINSLSVSYITCNNILHFKVLMVFGWVEHAAIDSSALPMNGLLITVAACI